MNIITQNAIAKLDDLAEWEILHLETLNRDNDPYDLHPVSRIGELAFQFLGLSEEAEEHIDFNRLGKAVVSRITTVRNR